MIPARGLDELRIDGAPLREPDVLVGRRGLLVSARVRRGAMLEAALCAAAEDRCRILVTVVLEGAGQALECGAHVRFAGRLAQEPHRLLLEVRLLGAAGRVLLRRLAPELALHARAIAPRLVQQQRGGRHGFWRPAIAPFPS